MNTLMISTMPTLLSLLVKGTALLLAAWMVCLLLRRTSAATRHLVWIAALGGVLLLPILSMSLPHWNVALRHAAAIPVLAPVQVAVVAPNNSVPDAVDKVGSPNIPIPQQAADDGPTSAAPAVTVQPKSSAVHSKALYSVPLVCAVLGLSIWVMGFIVVLAQFFIGLRQIGQIRRQAIPLDSLPHAVAEEVRRTFRSDHVEFLQAKAQSNVAVPVTWGLLRPTVLIPAQSVSWSEDCLRAALLHELAHVQRRDWLTQSAARFICALYWWHPLVWLAAKQAREESERACDDLVLGTGMKATDYAQRLVEVVRSMPTGAPTRTVAVAMAQPSEVEGRVKAVLARGRKRGSIPRHWMVGVFVTIGLVLLPLAALRIAAQADGSIITDEKIPFDAVVTRNTRWVFAAISLKDVACPRFPNRPITVVATKNSAGVEHFVFHDTRTGQSFRDSSQIEADLDHLLSQGTQKRLNASSYKLPDALAYLRHRNAWNVFFDTDQQKKADLLGKEAEGGTGRQYPLVLTDGDVASSASAAISDSGSSVKVTLLPEGEKKFAAFEQSHSGEYLGIVTYDSPLPRAAVLVGPTSTSPSIAVGGLTANEAKALVQALNTPDGTEVMGGGIRRASYPDGTIYEQDEDGQPRAIVASGYTAKLPNGSVVEVKQVTQSARNGDSWVSGGPRWTPAGKLLPTPPLGTAFRGAYTVGITDGLAPHQIELHVSPPSGSSATLPLSTYLQLDGTADVPWANTYQRWGDQIGPFYPQDGKPCTLRVGVASGPWQTTAVLPFHLSQQELPKATSASPWPLELKLDDRPALMYQDKQNHSHTEYFLPAGQRLGNVARRIVAVDTSGRTVVGSDWNSQPATVSDGRTSDVYPVATGIFDISFYGPLVSDVSRVREYRLETRPYQIVEFRNIQTEPKPTLPPGNATSTANTNASASATATANTASWKQSMKQVSTEEQQAPSAIRDAYNSGEGRMGILNIPRTWQGDKSSYRSALHLLNIQVSGTHALVTTRQVDSVSATDPKTGRRHEATADALFEGSWEKTPRGWIARSFLCKSLTDRIDGIKVTGSAKNLKSFFVAKRVWPPMPASYPYWEGDNKS